MAQPLHLFDMQSGFALVRCEFCHHQVCCGVDRETKHMVLGCSEASKQVQQEARPEEQAAWCCAQSFYCLDQCILELPRSCPGTAGYCMICLHHPVCTKLLPDHILQVILIHLSNLTGLSGHYSRRTMFLLVSDVGTVVWGTAAALAVGPAKPIFFCVGVCYSCLTYYNAARVYIESFHTVPKGICRKLVITLAWMFFSSWILFPLAFVAGAFSCPTSPGDRAPAREGLLWGTLLLTSNRRGNVLHPCQQPGRANGDKRHREH